MTASKYKKFIDRIREMVVILILHRRNLTINSNISEFYYMQKLEELKFLLYENAGTSKMLLEQEYEKIFCQWKRDVRLLRKLLSESVDTNS